MNKPDDIAATASLAEHPLPRAPWCRPSLRRIPARDAELGATPAIGDGSFTTS